MRLDRPSHVRESNLSSGWMSDFTEEIPGQIVAGINRLGDRGYEYYSIYPLPADAGIDERIYPNEWIQTAGTAQRLTVEVKRRDPDGVHRVYTVGRGGAADEPEESEVIQRGEHEYRVRPSEVLTAEDAIGLFQYYYDHDAVPASWHLREQPEFSAATSQGAEATPLAAPQGSGAGARGPVEKATPPTAKPSETGDDDETAQN
jgi:hypothetical protein